MTIHKQASLLLFSLLFLGLILFFFQKGPLFETMGNQDNTLSHKRLDVSLIQGGKNTMSFDGYVAETPIQKNLGLSVFDELDTKTGMLFIFKKTAVHSFWMKDMKFAIDIIWLDDKKNIVYIKENAGPSDYPEIYVPDAPSKYVFELVQGSVAEHNINIGDSFSWGNS